MFLFIFPIWRGLEIVYKRTLKILTKTSNSYCLFYCFNFYSVILNQETVLFVNLYFV